MSSVLVVGGGGREHAICWKLSQSDHVKQIFVSPGNAGISQVDKVILVELDVKNYEAVATWCLAKDVSLVVVGPEDPLAGGIADILRDAGICCFGPGRDGARIESDKSWAKGFMDRNGIPTAKWRSFTSAEEAKLFIQGASYAPLVVKASGLAAGKGVVVASGRDEACAAVDAVLTARKFGAAGDSVVVEELLQGEEVSVLAFCDGSTVKLMLPSQDHKRHLDGDQGANTGGMGAYCPCPLLCGRELEFVKKRVLQAAVDGLRKENISFTGVLYAGLMITADGPKVLEFNCRFGDPETEVILPLLESDLYSVMMMCCKGKLAEMDLKWKTDIYTVGVVMASRGYPETSTKGNVIEGLEEVCRLPDHLVFHSGTARHGGEVVTSGGRVLLVVARARELAVAAARATLACRLVRFDGAQHRTDIAHKGVARAILQKGKLTYKDSGVDIVAGDTLVDRIKRVVATTNRSGVVGGIGGFGGLFDVAAAGYRDPLLVSGTDGVGTKLKIAQLCGTHATIGQDLVAMCVNDILAHGAEPLFFLDYFACGKLDVGVAGQVVSGIAEACHTAGCALIGGETAEMPGLYSAGEYDLAGFAVGAVERSKLLPRVDEIRPGDIVIGLPSSGLHSNGFSLVRSIMQKSGVKYSDKAVFSPTGRTYGEELLCPTRLYVKGALPALRSGKVKAFAHVTGGGLTENIPRVLPPECRVTLDAAAWTIPPVVGWLAVAGGVSDAELLRTFNCGVGAVVITSSSEREAVISLLASEHATVIGKVERFSGDGRRVEVDNFISSMERVMQPYVPSLVRSLQPNRKRVAVLISGSGTNLQSLIDATNDPNQEVGAEIVLVISNKAKVAGLERAEKAGIPTKVISHKDHATRELFDAVLHAALEEAGAQLVCLAGFMRVLTGWFVARWRGRLINIHPALLPLFKGTHAHRQALEAGVRVTGCTAHFVEEDVDAGAILAQEAVPVEVGDTEETLQERVKVAEHRVFPTALRLVATGAVRLREDGTLAWRR
ncbi:trifunctional purine biosynthetic protein adenosine-3 isoform X2 [Bacillus rossius redtenbacheri]|uniref:trifunctional purine biosynthetic protein adenosine-3 isoform X2 n=1 Tax=Bacillus rossius redtenbacheri TaxID=93214 RepID=UPI002FDCDBDF